jgi:hypothetical protein
MIGQGSEQCAENRKGRQEKTSQRYLKFFSNFVSRKFKNYNSRKDAKHAKSGNKEGIFFFVLLAQPKADAPSGGVLTR